MTCASCAAEVVSLAMPNVYGCQQSSAAQQALPLAGFSVIEAENVEEVVKLVSNTPCARARGFIEIRPFLTEVDD